MGGGGGGVHGKELSPFDLPNEINFVSEYAPNNSVRISYSLKNPLIFSQYRAEKEIRFNKETAFYNLKYSKPRSVAVRELFMKICHIPDLHPFSWINALIA